jgi:hypothetical protein
MQGFITDRELTPDQVFPGIAEFFATLTVKPRTFLELVARFDHWCDAVERSQAPDSVSALRVAELGRAAARRG